LRKWAVKQRTGGESKNHNAKSYRMQGSTASNVVNVCGSSNTGGGGGTSGPTVGRIRRFGTGQKWGSGERSGGRGKGGVGVNCGERNLKCGGPGPFLKKWGSKSWCG